MAVINCIFCNREVWRGIAATFDNGTVLLPFIILLALVVILSFWPKRKLKTGDRYKWPLMKASLVAGIGLGGFVDGIVFHQLLQWHEMLSAQLPPVDYVTKSINMFWDGVFHSVTLLATLMGFLLLWRAARNPGNDLSGSLLAGRRAAGRLGSLQYTRRSTGSSHPGIA